MAGVSGSRDDSSCNRKCRNQLHSVASLGYEAQQGSSDPILSLRSSDGIDAKMLFSKDERIRIASWGDTSTWRVAFESP